MIDLFIIYILCSYGISNIIVYSSGPFEIFTRFRDYMDRMPSNFGELFRCMICFPTWVGIFMSLIDMFLIKDISFTPFNILFNNNIDLWYFIIAFDAAITSGTVWILNTIQEYLESFTNKNNGN